MDKILTVAVPAYNAEWCLEKCLASFVEESTIDALEVIVVNDGSTDGTEAIARRFVEAYPNTFRVVNKPNGGHGSGINVAADLATGQYFKVVDADDWVVTRNLPAFIQALIQTDAHAVLTHYSTVDMLTGFRKAYKTEGLVYGKIYTLDELMHIGIDALRCATFHGLTYNTSCYKSACIRLSEGIFYEDQEYATLPFAKAHTVLPLDLFIYEYLIGNVAQSVSEINQVRRIGHLEQVIWRLVDSYHEDLDESTKQYFLHKMSDALLSYYVIALVKNPNKKTGRIDAARLRGKLAVINDSLIARTDRRYRIAILLNRLHVSNKTLEWLKRTPLYTILYKAVRMK